MIAWLRRRCWFGFKHQGPWKDVGLKLKNYRRIGVYGVFHPVQQCATCLGERLDTTRFVTPRTPKSSPQSVSPVVNLVPPRERPN